MSSSTVKQIGYGISIVSVMLLGTVPWEKASEKPVMLACLIAGMATSIVGIVLRWVSHRREQTEK